MTGRNRLQAALVLILVCCAASLGCTGPTPEPSPTLTATTPTATPTGSPEASGSPSPAASGSPTHTGSPSASGSPSTPVSPAASGSPAASPATPPHTPSVTGDSATPDASGNINVTLTDKGMTPKIFNVPARKNVTFVVRNNGSKRLGFKVEGLKQLEPPVEPGGEGRLTMNFGPGTYSVRQPGQEGSKDFTGEVVSK